MSQNAKIAGHQFLEKLKQGNGSFRSADHGLVEVEHGVIVDGKKLGLGNIHIDGVNFTGKVILRNFEGGYLLVLQRSHFKGGLYIEKINCDRVCVTCCYMSSLETSLCQLHSVSFDHTEVKGLADVSGIRIAEYLQLTDNKLPDVQLLHTGTFERITTPAVETDDLTLAFQFKMAGIPVFMTTAGARQMMRDLSRADEVLDG